MRRVRASRTAAPGQSINIGIRLTRVSADTSSVRSSTTMNIVRNISGPFESDLGGGSGALPGTEPGLAGSYQYQMEGIIATDTLSWRSEDSEQLDPITATLVSFSGNVAVFDFVVTGTLGVALIYCSVNGVEFVTNARIANP